MLKPDEKLTMDEDLGMICDTCVKEAKYIRNPKRVWDIKNKSWKEVL